MRRKEGVRVRRMAALVLAVAVAGGCGGRRAAQTAPSAPPVTPVARRLLGMTPEAAQRRFDRPSLVLTDMQDADRFAGRLVPPGDQPFTAGEGYRYQWHLNDDGRVSAVTVFVAWPGADPGAGGYQRVRAWLGLVLPAMSRHDRESFISDLAAAALQQWPNRQFGADLYGVAWVVERHGDILRVSAQIPEDQPAGPSLRVQRDRPLPFSTAQARARFKARGVAWYGSSAGSGEWEGLSVVTGAIGAPAAALTGDATPLTVVELVGAPQPYKLIAVPPVPGAFRHPEAVLPQAHLTAVMRLAAPAATAADGAFARAQLERLQQAPELEAYTWVQYGVRFTVAGEYRDAGAEGKGEYYTFMAEGG